MKRSDLICENAVINAKGEDLFVHKKEINGTKTELVTISEEQSERYGKASGSYYTLYMESGDIKGSVASVIRELIPEGKALIVGLGNSEIASDRLGSACLSYIPATAHLSAHEDFHALGLRRISVIGTGVTGKSGIESSDYIRYIAEGERADFIIAVDSLACSSRERLCRTVQITDTGISPGSGVGNRRKRLDKTVCGIPVIAVGVPTVMDFFDEEGESLMVTPRNIDLHVKKLSELIGIGISMALNPSLSESEIRKLII